MSLSDMNPECTIVNRPRYIITEPGVGYRIKIDE